MNKSFIKTMMLAALMALSIGAKAQTFAGITEEQNAQNTPEGWQAVTLPNLPTITAANTTTVSGLSATADNTATIQAALNNVPAAGGMVVIPAGTWLCGPIQIKSKTILHLAKNCTLKLLPYGTYPNNKSNFIQEKKNSTDIVIEGEDKATSVIDGQGEAWWRALDQDVKLNRGALVRFTSGQRFLIRNMSFKNAPGANVTLGNKSAQNNSAYRLNATVHDIYIYAPASELNPKGSTYPSHNTDGIPVWDPYANIYNCEINNGDDNVVCDSYAQYIHVWNCKFGTGHGASVGSFTKATKHVWFDQITMNGTTAGIRLKTGVNTDGTLRGGGEEDFRFTNFTMTKVANPFSMDCYYDKLYNNDPATDEKNARALDATTPTYNNILLQNVKTTDVSSGKAIFLVGRPESHIKNVTLDNVQIKAKTGIDARFVDNLVFQNGTKITKSSGNIWIKKYKVTFSGDPTGSDTPTPPSPGVGDDITLTLDATTATSVSGASSPWAFNNGCTISNGRGSKYATAKVNTLKYSKSVDYTISLPENVSITSATFAGYSNEDNNSCYISSMNGVSFGASSYVFGGRAIIGTTTDTQYNIPLETPATEAVTFQVTGAQAAFIITLKGKVTGTSGITGITTNQKINANNNVYDLSGRLVVKGASSQALQGLSKGIYIYNGKKYIVK